jgi:hypothetical protein
MNDEDFELMARQAGLLGGDGRSGPWAGVYEMKRFAAMVAEECTKACEERGAAYRDTQAPGWHEVNHESAQNAAAVRARFPMPRRYG